MSTVTYRLFISYRREETAGHAGRLYDVLAARWGEGNVFMDVDLAPGVDFVERITQAVGACRVLLVVMGPTWATLTDSDQQVRLADSEDFVRLEVETALARSDVTVIPLLVGGARMPDPDDLPTGLRALTRHNALELSDLRWRYDVQRLVGALDELLAGLTGIHPLPAAPAAPPPPDPHSEPRRTGGSVRTVLEALLLATIAGLAAAVLGEELLTGEPTKDLERLAKSVLTGAGTWAIVGCVVATWLTLMRARGGGAVRQGIGGLIAGALAGAAGGAIFSLRLAGEPNATVDVVRELSLASLAVTGAILGAYLGTVWTPARVGGGFLAGLIAGALLQFVLFGGRVATPGAGWDVGGKWDRVIKAGIEAGVIVAVVLAVFVALNARRRTPP